MSRTISLKMLDDCPNVFVYGTLKRGRGNHVILDSSPYLGAAITCDDFALGDAGVPYAFPEDVVPKEYHGSILHPIIGELYRMDSERVAERLDALEGYPQYYYRRITDVQVISTKVVYPAWIYTIEDFDYATWCDAAHFDKGAWSWV